MSLANIVKDDYGQEIQLTFIDVDTSAAADISGYSSTISMIFTSPSGASTTKTAAFEDDGTDGVISYTIESGLLDAAGQWQVRGRVSSGVATLTTARHYFDVLD